MKPLTLLIFLFFSNSLFCQSNPIVKPFLENIVTMFPNVRDLALSPQKNEAVFSAQNAIGDVSALVIVNLDNNQWTNPHILPFSGTYFDIEPYFSNDGLTLYFASNRPIDETLKTAKDFDIWYVVRASLNSKWSEPKNMGAPINSDLDEFYPILTNSGNLYFTLDDPKLNHKDNIYVSEKINDSYSTPKLLSENINSEGYEFNAYVAPDESFIIYTCYNRADGFGSGDLYLSLKTKNNTWTEAKNMGPEINSNKMDYCPFVDFETKTLYFTSKRINSNTDKTSAKNINELIKEFNQYQNGLSRLYQVNISKYLNNVN